MDDLKQYQQISLLSILLNHPEVFDECQGIKKEYFDDEFSDIFEFMLEEHNKGIEISPYGIIKQLGQDKTEIVKAMMTCHTVIQEKNRIIKLMKQEGQQTYALRKIKSIIENSEGKMFYDVYEKLSEIEPYSKESEKDYKNLSLKRLEERMNRGGQIAGITTGIKEFDETINGFNNGCLYICAGRSSMGKSAFMTSAISNIEKRHKVGIISLEMTGEEIYNRICAVRIEVPYWVIDRGRTNDYQFERYANEITGIKNIKMFDKGSQNQYQICAIIRNMVKDGCEMVFIDHLGLIQVEEKGNLAHNIGKITSALKSIAKELEIPIVCLCQVNRAADSQEDKRPSLKDLRDSGRIEEDADCVFFIYRDEYYNPIVDEKGNQNRYEKASVLIEKNRNGACKIINCNFDNQLMKFYAEEI